MINLCIEQSTDVNGMKIFILMVFVHRGIEYVLLNFDPRVLLGFDKAGISSYGLKFMPYYIEIRVYIFFYLKTRIFQYI